MGYAIHRSCRRQTILKLGANFETLQETTSSKLVQPELAESNKFPIHTWANILDDCTIAGCSNIHLQDDEGIHRPLEIEILTLDYVLLAQMSNDILADWPQADIEGLLAELESNSIITLTSKNCGKVSRLALHAR